MKCVSSTTRFIKNFHSGSVSVETAIIMPFLFFVFFLFLSFFQYIAAYLNIYQAADNTARYMSYYSGIYYREGIEKLNGIVSAELYSHFDKNGAVASELFSNVTGNVACNALAEIIFEKQIEKNADIFINSFYAIEDISFVGSSFFEDDNRFDLKVTCLIDTFFPLPKFFGKGYLINVDIKGNGWLGGSYFVKESEPSVWELDNFERGKVLEDYFGCNLPYDYPVIDSFDRKSGTVTIIRSIDHTTKTYLRTEQFKKTLEESLLKIKNFKGTEGFSSVSSDNFIGADKIKKRKLILVVPTNDMTAAQTKAFLEFSAKCAMNNVELVLERYHASY